MSAWPSRCGAFGARPWPIRHRAGAPGRRCCFALRWESPGARSGSSSSSAPRATPGGAARDAALKRTSLPADLDPYLTNIMLDRIKVDKKRISDKVQFIAIREVGMCEPVEIAVTELRRILRRQSAA